MLGWLAIELAFVLAFVVETKGRTLEETAILFDGEDRRDDLAHMGGEAATTQLSRAIVLQDRTRSTKEEEDRVGMEAMQFAERRRFSAQTDMTDDVNWLKREEVL
ncbi:hypothetical protein C8J57DRAFT_706256 [Mycena rebaudengoi]|nr:hypothetical protein C8J57DRAFT_706256 [Mycena rebaudengoi]